MKLFRDKWLELRVVDLQRQINDQQEVIDFLCKHDRKEVYVDYACNGFGIIECFAKFLFNRRMRTAKICDMCLGKVLVSEVINNTNNDFVICAKDKENNIVKYYKVDKSSCNAMDVTEYYKKDEKESDTDGTKD